MSAQYSAEQLRVILEQQKTSSSILRFAAELRSKLDLAWQPATHESEDLLKFANSDYDESIKHLLLAANALTDVLENTSSVFDRVISDEDARNIKRLRDIWEHRPEKVRTFNGKWAEKKKFTRIWLDDQFGDNWSMAFSVTIGPKGRYLAGLISLDRLEAEANYWLGITID